MEGTIATLSCEPLYEEPGLELMSSRTCRDGRWNGHLSQCYPGEKPNVIINVYNIFVNINVANEKNSFDVTAS